MAEHGVTAVVRPSGIVTFLFTDIEGSTRLWEERGDGMRMALERHDEIIRAAVAAHEGYVFSTAGHAFCVAFCTSARAVSCGGARTSRAAG